MAIAGRKIRRVIQGISEALGRDPNSLDLSKRHPLISNGIESRPGNAISLIMRIQPNGSYIW